MSTTSTDASYKASRNSYANDSMIGVWKGLWWGVLTIIPTMIVGIITIPFTFPVVIWKTID